MNDDQPDDRVNFRDQMVLAKIEGMTEEIRRGVAFIANHPDTPEFFKNHPVVKELIEEDGDR